MNHFGKLLNYYRKRSIDPERNRTLSQERLGELLGRSLGGAGYTGAAVSDWEREKSKINEDHRLVLAGLIKVLHECKGVQSLDEANQLLAAGNYRQLNEEEVRHISLEWLVNKIGQEEQQQVPFRTSAQGSNVGNASLTVAFKSWLDGVFRWSEASEHMRSSREGMVLWSLSAVTNRLTPQFWLTLLTTIALWLITALLVIPILQWPLASSQARLVAGIKYSIASLGIPLLVGALTNPEYQADFQLETKKQRYTLLFLKMTGALVGFNTFFGPLLGLALFLYYVRIPTLPVYAWAFLILIFPLLFSYIGARRIPADRYNMFGNIPQLHEADKLFFGVFLFFGPVLTGFIYLFYSFLADRVTGFALLLTLIGVALWEQRKGIPTYLSDVALILLIGLFLPLTIVLLYLFLSPQFDFGTFSTVEQYLLVFLAIVYVLGPIILWVTLSLRNKPVLTLRGALGLLFVLVILNEALAIHPQFGRWLTLAVLGVWFLWRRKHFRRFLWIHFSFAILMAVIGLSLYLVVHMVIPLWANVFGTVFITTVLVFWSGVGVKLDDGDNANPKHHG